MLVPRSICPWDGINAPGIFGTRRNIQSVIWAHRQENLSKSIINRCITISDNTGVSVAEDTPSREMTG